MNAGVPFLLGLIVTAGILVPLLLKFRGEAENLKRRSDALANQNNQLRHKHQRLEQDLEFLTLFLREFPRLARNLYSGAKERQIPRMLLEVVVRSLGPRQAVVLVPRGGEKKEAESGRAYVVGATVPEGAEPKPGTELILEGGALSFVADSQQVMSREDFASETELSGRKLASELSGFELDLVAPLVHDQETLGLMALSKPRRTSADAKAALRLIAQTGAQSLQAAAAYTQMKASAETDGLTHVFNKEHITRRLAELVYQTACVAYERQRAGGEGPQGAAEKLSIFLFDIDHFKSYNDVNGHVAGDKLLQELARLVEANIRKDDVFGRFGGEEFLILFPETTREQALAAATKLRDVIASHPFPYSDKQPMGKVSISGGVAEYPTNAKEARALIRAADAALYKAKGEGRNLVLAAVGETHSEAPETGLPVRTRSAR